MTFTNQKTCSNCKNTKDLSSFWKDKTASDGYYYWCNDCTKDKRKSRKLISRVDISYKGKLIPGTSLTLLDIVSKPIIYKTGKKSKFKSASYRCRCGYENSCKLSDIQRGQTTSCGRSGCSYSRHGKASLASVLLEDKETNFFITHTQFNEIKGSAKERKKEFNLEPQDILAIWKKQGGKCEYTGLKLSCGGLGGLFKEERTVSVDRIDNDKGYTKNNILLCHKAANMSRGPYPLIVFVIMCVLVAIKYKHLIQQIMNMPEDKINDMFNKATKSISIGNKNKNLIDELKNDTGIIL